jgi:hypothetical protein
MAISNVKTMKNQPSRSQTNSFRSRLIFDATLLAIF